MIVLPMERLELIGIEPCDLAQLLKVPIRVLELTLRLPLDVGSYVLVAIELRVFIDIDELRNCASSPATSLLLGILINHDAIGQLFKLRKRLLLFVSQLSISAGQCSPQNLCRSHHLSSPRVT
ncbi:hypothetical protein D3C85_1235910 [compost metagenome]